jgi:hypothetical protein
MNFKEISWQGVDWNDLAQAEVRKKWWAVVELNYNIKNALPEGLSLGGPMSHFGVSMADRTAIVATTVRSVHSKLRAVTIT